MTNTHPTAIVYGPRGCGKTTHAHEIAHRLRIPRSNIIDEANITRARHIKPGFLHLCITEPFGIRLPQGCVVMPYADLGFPDLRPGAMEAAAVYRGGQTGAPTVTMESPTETRARLNPNRIDHAIGATRDRISRAVAGAQTFTPLPPPSPEDVARMRLTNEIERERRRQIEAEGYAHADDDALAKGELASMAAAYAAMAANDERASMHCWPWDDPAPKSLASQPRRALIIAAALILAEIERLDRLTAQPKGEGA